MKTIMIILGSMLGFLILYAYVSILIGYSIDQMEQQDKVYHKCLSNHGSDWGCDSCFHAVYGYWPEE